MSHEFKPMTREYLDQLMQEEMLLDHFEMDPLIIESLDRYMNEKIPCGGFLNAVLENDLFEAMGKADARNRVTIFLICRYIYNNLPAQSFGSKELVAEWLGGSRG
jgi:hypothetical protein